MSTFSLVLNKRITVVRRRFAPRRHVGARETGVSGFRQRISNIRGCWDSPNTALVLPLFFVPWAALTFAVFRKIPYGGNRFSSTYLYTRAFKARLFEYRLPKPKPRNPPFTRHATTERRHGNRSPCRYVNWMFFVDRNSAVSVPGATNVGRRIVSFPGRCYLGSIVPAILCPLAPLPESFRVRRALFYEDCTWPPDASRGQGTRKGVPPRAWLLSPQTGDLSPTWNDETPTYDKLTIVSDIPDWNGAVVC